MSFKSHKKKLSLRKTGQHSYSVSIGSKKIGKFIQDVDGFYYYSANREGGLWSAHTMRMIADRLDKLNKPWDNYIAKNLKPDL